MQQRFLNRGKEETLQKGAKLFGKGDPCSAGDIYYVVSGTVRIDLPVPGAAGQRELGPGELVGLEEPYGGTRHRQRTATAQAPTVVYRWTRRAFDDAMGIYQELATQAIKTLSKNLRDINRATARREAPRA